MPPKSKADYAAYQQLRKDIPAGNIFPLYIPWGGGLSPGLSAWGR